MNYRETEQKQLLRGMERELMALLVIDPDSEEYEVIYTDGAYREFRNRYSGCGFFEKWRDTALSRICEEDRKKIAEEITKDRLAAVRDQAGCFVTECRFLEGSRSKWCRIRVMPNELDSKTVVMGIRDIDEEIRRETQHLREMEVLLSRDRDIRELEETLKQMRMKNFISQMHPHFLYNALSSIREIVLTDPEYGADMLYDFTTHLRASIRAMSNDREIWFSQELENIKAYVSIEKMRFGENLRVLYEIEAEDFRIIPLSIQPLVENAIKHGLYEKGDDGGTVVIRTAQDSDGWTITVQDDGVGFDTDKVLREAEDGSRDSTGLHNLLFRMENMMHARVDIASEAGKGTVVTVLIPREKSAVSPALVPGE